MKIKNLLKNILEKNISNAVLFFVIILFGFLAAFPVYAQTATEVITCTSESELPPPTTTCPNVFPSINPPPTTYAQSVALLNAVSAYVAVAGQPIAYNAPGGYPVTTAVLNTMPASEVSATGKQNFMAFVEGAGGPQSSGWDDVGALSFLAGRLAAYPACAPGNSNKSVWDTDSLTCSSQEVGMTVTVDGLSYVVGTPTYGTPPGWWLSGASISAECPAMAMVCSEQPDGAWNSTYDQCITTGAQPQTMLGKCANELLLESGENPYQCNVAGQCKTLSSTPTQATPLYNCGKGLQSQACAYTYGNGIDYSYTTGLPCTISGGNCVSTSATVVSSTSSPSSFTTTVNSCSAAIAAAEANAAVTATFIQEWSRGQVTNASAATMQGYINAAASSTVAVPNCPPGSLTPFVVTPPTASALAGSSATSVSTNAQTVNNTQTQNSTINPSSCGAKALPGLASSSVALENLASSLPAGSPLLSSVENLVTVNTRTVSNIKNCLAQTPSGSSQGGNGAGGTSTGGSGVMCPSWGCNGYPFASTTPPTSGGSSCPPGTFCRLTVTVTANTLNVRSGANTSASLAGSRTLAQGNTFTATGEVQGQCINGNCLWYLSSKGNFVSAVGAVVTGGNIVPVLPGSNCTANPGSSACPGVSSTSGSGGTVVTHSDGPGTAGGSGGNGSGGGDTTATSPPASTSALSSGSGSGSPSSVSITSSTPNGYVGQTNYLATFKASDGLADATFQMSGTGAPAGLAWGYVVGSSGCVVGASQQQISDPALLELCRVSGSPLTQAGDFTVSVIALDTANNLSLTKQFNIHIAPYVAPPTLLNLNPSSGRPGVSVTVNGTGFTPTGNTVYMDGYSSGYAIASGLSSSNGTSLTFTMPTYENVAEPPVSVPIWPAPHAITVSNSGQADGTAGVPSGPQNFTITPPMDEDLSVSSSSLTFTAAQGQTPSPQTVTVSTNSSDFVYYRIQGATGSWLTATGQGCSPAGCYVTKGQPSTITFSVNPGSLAPGTYNDAVTISPADGTNIVGVGVWLTVMSANQ